MGEGNDRPLTVITGDRKTRERRAGRRRALDQNEQITCWRCENDTGIATSMAVRVILAPRRTPLGRLVPCAAFSASSRLFDLNGEASRVSKKQNRAIIAADVGRFGHVINTDGVLGSH